MRDHETDEPLTEELLEELMSAPSIVRYVGKHDLETPGLSEYLNRQLEERGLKLADVLRNAEIEHTFGWYVFNGQRGIGRDNMLKLCFAMEFDVRHANRALQAAGVNTLYPKNRRDAIVIFCLEHGCTLQQANEVLYDFGEECL